MKVRDRLKAVTPIPLVRFLKYRAAQRLLEKGPGLGTPDASVLFFTVHKCASSLMARLLTAVNREHLGLTRVDAAGFAQLAKDSQTSRDAYAYITANAGKLFHPHGYLYGPLRRFVEIDNLDRYRVSLMLRDPRDVLVSQYYSLAYSHPLPFHRAAREEFLARREAARATDVDTFVLREVAWVRDVYETYWNRLVCEQNVTPLRYEDMWRDFGCWLSRFLQELELDLDSESLERLERRLAPKPAPKEESIHRHRRKGTPGDHREKLRKETVTQLNELLKAPLARFRYDTSPTS